MSAVPSLVELRAAAAEMSQRGLTVSDIGSALRIDPAAVRRLLAADEPQAAAMHAAAWSGRHPSINDHWRQQ